MSRLKTGKLALGIGMAVLAGLTILWLLAQVVSAVIWIFYLFAIAVGAILSTYIVYELWSGWKRAG